MRTAGGGRGVRACIVITGITLVGIGGVAAAPIVTFSGTVSETYNDNVALVPQSARQARDWITAITPSVSILDEGRRVQLDLIYSPTELIYAGDIPFTTLQQNLVSRGQAELLKDTLFFKEQAAITPQFINGFGAIGPTTYTTNSNLQSIVQYQLSSFLRHRFNDIADIETLFDYGRVSASGDSLAPLESEELRQTITGGAYFGRLGWTLTADAMRDRIGTVPGAITPSGLLKNDVARADLKYAISRRLAITASGGYEEISFPSVLPTSTTINVGGGSGHILPALVPALRGPIWNAGFTYTPNPRFFFSATYGSRYNAPDYEISARYSAALTTASLTYSEVIETTSMMLLSNIGQLGFLGALPINTVTGLPFTGNASFGNIPALVPSSLNDAAFLAKFLTASLTTTRGRNTFTAYASYGTEHVYAPPLTDVFYTASLAWARNVLPELTGTVSASYSQGSLALSSTDERTYSLLGSLAYTLSADSAVNFSVAMSKIQSGVSSSAIADDVATVSYTRRF